MKILRSLIFLIFLIFVPLSIYSQEKRYNIPTEDSPSIGPKDAPVTIVEFLDYQCAHCIDIAPQILKLMKEFDGKVRVVIKFFPYKYRDYARISAEAAVEAWKQGKFYEMHELLLKKSPALDRDSLIKYAKQLNLDVEKFTKAIDNNEGSAIIERDLALAKSLGLWGTPVFFINGIKIIGNRDYEFFRQIVIKELEGAKAKR